MLMHAIYLIISPNKSNNYNKKRDDIKKKIKKRKKEGIILSVQR
jgi:hypothetical protein